MRRLYLLLSLTMATAWLLWSACERDNYRNELPLRPLDGGPRATPTDMPVDLAKPADLAPTDLPPAMDMPLQLDGGSSDAGTKTDGGLPDGAVAG
jgi:hypothetical protein